MKFNRKDNTYSSDNGNQGNKRTSLFQKIEQYIGDAINDQFFYKTRTRILDFIEKKNIRKALVELHVSKKGLTYECSYDLYFPDQQGTMMVSKGFFVANLSSAGFIPQYIIDEVKQNGTAEIDFSTEDLETLYSEKTVEVKEEATYNDLVQELKEKSFSRIVMIDRVYYTRVQCYDVAGKMCGIAHIAAISNIPVNIKSSLYPCGSCEVSL